jgi:SNF2 family DNA or RNA helicase
VNLDELRRRISGVALRREKEGTIALPQKTVTRIPVTLEGKQAALYNELRQNLAVMVRAMSGDELLANAQSILARLVRLAQLASNPNLIDASYTEVPAKFRALDRLLEAYLADQSRKVIVWTSFVPHIAMLCARYPQHRPVALHGEMTGDARDASIAAFLNDPSVRLLFANPAAAREGLTLTTANVAIYLDRTFNLVDFIQSQDRIHRLSQTRACEVVLLVAASTIDEFIDFSLAQKHRLARYAQSDTDSIDGADLELQKPDVLRALLRPV